MITATNNITLHCRQGLITALLSILFWSICQNSVMAQAPTLLLRQPALSEQHIAFVYGGDLWISNLDGENPRRLTSHPAIESSPKFSPDGKWIAFSANYESNKDVYVISVAGGPARRLTWHPGDDTVNGWSAEGKSILFASAREIRSGRSNQLYHIALEGAYPEKLMEAHAFEGAWSADGKRLAYRPYLAAQVGDSGWRLHRGGSTPPIWIIDPKTQAVEKIPHPRANESNPMWQGDTVYFMSDRDNEAVNLFSYNTVNKDIRQLTKQTQWDVKSADIFKHKIIFEAGGRLKIYDIKRNRLQDISISINPDSPQTRPAWKDVSSNLQRIELSPTGKRALITARGDIFTVPLKDGSTRNITATGGVREKDAIWSPQGDKLAYISDQGSVHTLIVTDQTGRGEKQSYKLGDTDYYTLLAWGKKGKKVIYEDNHLNLFFIELSTGLKTLIRTDLRREGTAIALSPDGKWLAYTNYLANYFSKIMLYEFSTGKSHELTDGLSLAWSPVFSRDGKYLYFTASTNAGPLRVGLDMSTQEKPLRNAIYAIVLAADGKSPLLPKSGDELDSEEKKSDD
ncbi:MAG: PD40 domain-containing protein [Deltaproteobacteria bacterium]|nr:PD40 domain-containing protein [Deltaproteobacteria bacterium]